MTRPAQKMGQVADYAAGVLCRVALHVMNHDRCIFECAPGAVRCERVACVCERESAAVRIRVSALKLVRVTALCHHRGAFPLL